MSSFSPFAGRGAPALSAAAVLGIAVLLSGCSREKLDALVEQARQQAEQAAQSVKESAQGAGESVSQAARSAQEQAGLAGSAEILLAPPLKTQACYVRLVTFHDGRPGMLQFVSAWRADAETFPSVLLHAPTQAASLSELSGQVLEAQVFAMPRAEGPVWRTPEAAPAELKILSVDSKTVRAELVGGSLIEVGGGGSAAAAGRLEAAPL